MGTLILVSGPNDSGKSVFAETLIARSSQTKRYYIATMVPHTEENRTRIAKHRKQRAGMEFVTLELPRGVDQAPVEAHSAVLLEDVSNLLANHMFDGGGDEQAALGEIRRLQARCDLLVAVTIAGLEPEGYTGETDRYIRALKTLNGHLFHIADIAVEMVHGVPHYRKGEAHGMA